MQPTRQLHDLGAVVERVLLPRLGLLAGARIVILSQSGGSEGIGFTIPVDLVRTVVAILRTKGRVSRAWLGLWTGPPRQDQGARVVAVEAGGPAARAGIEPGDVIVRFGASQVRRPQDVTSVVLGGEPGERRAIDLVRNGKPATVEVQLALRPAQRRLPERFSRSSRADAGVHQAIHVCASNVRAFLMAVVSVASGS